MIAGKGADHCISLSHYKYVGEGQTYQFAQVPRVLKREHISLDKSCVRAAPVDKVYGVISAVPFDGFCNAFHGVTANVNIFSPDDDTYAFLPNLAALLTLGFSPDWPYVLGRPWRAEGVTYLCGGPGYVLSRAAMDRVCARVGDFLTHHWPSYWSDINMGGFLPALNITFVMSTSRTLNSRLASCAMLAISVTARS